MWWRRPVLLCALGPIGFTCGLLVGQYAGYQGLGILRSRPSEAARRLTGSPDASTPSLLTVGDLLQMSADRLEQTDPLEVDLAVARTIPGSEGLDVGKYKRMADEWAEHIRSETVRHLHRFRENPGEYKDSLPYFKALVLATVIGQDYRVAYDTAAVAFEDPGDLFVHGVLDKRRGTCVSLPVLYLAMGHRLGYPIRAVTVARHVFCRWDDPVTGERLNIEAAGAGGLVDHPDEYYLSWPTKCDPEDVTQGGMLKSLTMREFLALKLASSGDYYWHKGQRPEAQVAYAQAHRLFPASRTIYEILASQILEESERYPWSSTYRLYEELSCPSQRSTRRPAG